MHASGSFGVACFLEGNAFGPEHDHLKCSQDRDSTGGRLGDSVASQRRRAAGREEDKEYRDEHDDHNRVHHGSGAGAPPPRRGLPWGGLLLEAVPLGAGGMGPLLTLSIMLPTQRGRGSAPDARDETQIAAGPSLKERTGGVAPPNRWAVLALVALGTFMTTLDTSI